MRFGLEYAYALALRLFSENVSILNTLLKGSISSQKRRTRLGIQFLVILESLIVCLQCIHDAFISVKRIAVTISLVL